MVAMGRCDNASSAARGYPYHYLSCLQFYAMQAPDQVYRLGLMEAPTEGDSDMGS